MKNKQKVRYQVIPGTETTIARLSGCDLYPEFERLLDDDLFWTGSDSHAPKFNPPGIPDFKAQATTHGDDEFDEQTGKYVAKAKIYQSVYRYKKRVLKYLIEQHEALVKEYKREYNRCNEIIGHFIDVRDNYIENRVTGNGVLSPIVSNALNEKRKMEEVKREETKKDSSITLKGATMPERSCILDNKKFVYDPDTKTYEYNDVGDGYKHQITISGTDNVLNNKKMLEGMMKEVKGDPFEKINKQFSDQFMELQRQFARVNQLFNGFNNFIV